MTDVAQFKKPKAKARASRLRSEAQSNDIDDTSSDSSGVAVALKVRKQQKERIKPKAKLSFGGDEDADGDVFTVKKQFSKKLNLGGSLSSSLLSEASEQPGQSSGVVYSKEYLSELRAGTKSAPSPANQSPSHQDVDLVFDSSEMAGAVIVDEDTPMDVVTEIPPEASVAAAKERRERIRQGQAGQKEDGFIALDVTTRADVYQGPHPESRLMREDDDLGDGEDDFSEFTSAKERIALGKKAKKKEAATRRAAMQEMINDAEEEDEETQEWERSQLRKITRQGSEPLERERKAEYKPAPIPTPIALPSLDAAIHRLSESMSQLLASHSSNTSSISQLADERLTIEIKEKDMRELVVSAENKRSWFSGFRDWVEAVAAFLDEKYPMLEKLEGEHLSLIKERSDMIGKRRLQDDLDDLSRVFGNITNTNEVEMDQTDELGRVIPGANNSTVRSQRLSERKRRHQRHITQEEEGYSTDSSLLASDEADFQTAIESLRTRAKDILSDVRSDEFREPRKGLGRWFGDWRKKYPDSYEGAFGGLGMLSAWEFWARLEILGWDPISGPRPFDGFKWYGSLHDYSRPRSGDDNMDNENELLGPEGDLAPAMVSTIVPRMCKLVEGGAFDPYSSKHVRSVIELSEQVEVYATEEKINYLLKTVMTLFRQAIDDDIKSLRPYLEADNNMKFDPEAIPARRRYLMKRFKLLSNLCRWRKHTGEKFGLGEIATRLVTSCIRPVAQSGWEVGGEVIMQKITSVLPPELRSCLTNGD